MSSSRAETTSTTLGVAAYLLLSDVGKCVHASVSALHSDPRPEALGFPAVDVWCPLLLHVSQNLKSLVPSLGRKKGERWRLCDLLE